MSEEGIESIVVPRAADQPHRPRGRGLHTKLILAVLIAAVGAGASVMSCVGQSFALRQARALEGIEEQLLLLRQQGCSDGGLPHRE